MARRKLCIYISEQQIADAREAQIKFPTHVEYVAYRFKIEHNVLVINHRLLKVDVAPNEKMFRYTGEIGVAISDRIS